MDDIIGYVAFFFICAFGPIQLWDMYRGHTRDLGAWPLASLVLGLSLLLTQLILDGAETYLLVGNFTALAFNLVNFCVVIGGWSYERELRKSMDEAIPRNVQRTLEARTRGESR